MSNARIVPVDMPPVVAKRLGYALKRAQHAMRTGIDHVLRPIELTMAQYAVLCALEAEAGMSNARLARAAFVTAPTMHGVLSNLERDGAIRRRPDPDNARILRSELTAKGQALLLSAHEAVAIVERIMMASLGEDKAVEIAEALYRCADNLTAAELGSNMDLLEFKCKAAPRAR